MLRRGSCGAAGARAPARVRVALGWFSAQLLLNATWSPLFFGLQSPALGLLNIVVLDAAVVATILAFRRVHTGAAALLIPYLGWIGFATALNFAIWTLNG